MLIRGNCDQQDTRLDQHEKENTFGENLYIPIARPLLPLFVSKSFSWCAHG